MKDFEDLKSLYLRMKERRGEEAYRYMHELLEEAKKLRYAYLDEHDSDKDKGQSWRSFKGKHFQKLIQYIITDSIEILGFKVVNGDKLEKTNTQNLSQELRQVKESLVIDYGEFGVRLPDADIVIYNPENSHIIAIVSSKTSLRERIAHTGYWKFKLLANEDTKHIKVYLITPDTDKLLTRADPARKERIIAEAELDGTYVLTKENLQESENVKLFKHFIEDFKKVIEESR